MGAEIGISTNRLHARGPRGAGGAHHHQVRRARRRSDPTLSAATRAGNRPSYATMRRAVITGLGAVTPVGNDVPTTWANLVAGGSGVEVISRFDANDYPVNIAAQVKDFDPTVAMSVKETRKTGPDVHFGVAAAMEARARLGARRTSPRPGPG